MFNDTKTIKNYILSLKEHIKRLEKELADNTFHKEAIYEREIITEMVTLQIVRDDLQKMLDNAMQGRTYWITFDNKERGEYA